LLIFRFIYLRMNIYFAYQLANALQYLSHLNLIHNDVATRNCLFYSDYTIKLTDCAMALSQYEHEYWSTNNGHLIPLRWIAPEALTVNNSFFYFRIFIYLKILDKSDDKI
jgi:serine/threonine protein kinase